MCYVCQQSLHDYWLPKGLPNRRPANGHHSWFDRHVSAQCYLAFFQLLLSLQSSNKMKQCAVVTVLVVKCVISGIYGNSVDVTMPYVRCALLMHRWPTLQMVGQQRKFWVGRYTENTLCKKVSVPEGQLLRKGKWSETIARKGIYENTSITITKNLGQRLYRFFLS